MNCHNCGAPMQVVSSRDYFYCPYCTSFHFPPESSDGVRVLGELGQVDCPLCRQRLVSAAVVGMPVLYCTKCRGVLVMQDVFSLLVPHLRACHSGPSRPPRPLDRAELERELACPSCGRPMRDHPYYGPGNVIIDVCAPCRLIWLDHLELRAIAEAPGRDRR